MRFRCAAAVIVGFVFVGYGSAQPRGGENLAPPYSFEVSSIRPTSAQSSFNSVRMDFEPDGYAAFNISLQMLVKTAYGIEDYQVVDNSKLLSAAKYDIRATVDPSAADAIGKLSQEERKQIQQRMLQGLLADRFKLTVHREFRDLPVYFLVVGKNGPKFRQSKPNDDYHNGLKTIDGMPLGPHMGRMALGGGDISVQGLPMASLTSSLTRELRTPVLDKTGLTGAYDFSLQWQPAAQSMPGPENTGPTLFEAVEEQLGLRLEATKAPVAVLLIDHAESPSPN